MKKIIVLLFMIIVGSTYGDIIGTNGKVSFYYSEDENVVRNIRGNVFGPIAIDRFDIGLYIDGKTYFGEEEKRKVTYLNGSGTIKIENTLGGIDAVTYIVASGLFKDKVYVYTKLNNQKIHPNLKIIYKIHPYNGIVKIEKDKERGDYKIDNVSFVSVGNKNQIFTTKGDVRKLEELREVKGEYIKEASETILFTANLEDKLGETDVLVVDFSGREIDEVGQGAIAALKEEYSYWKDLNLEYSIYPDEIKEQLMRLRSITSVDPIPSYISHKRSVESLSTNMRISLTYLLYDNIKEGREILEKYKVKRKNSYQDIAVMLALLDTFEINKRKGVELDDKTRLYPLMDRILSGIDINGRFNIADQNIRVYYTLITLLERILENQENIDGLPLKKEIELKLELVKNYTEKNYLSEDGVKDYPEGVESNPKNIKYISLLPKEIQKKILLSNYKKYYNRRSGFLQLPDEERDVIDMEYNLSFGIELFRNGYEGEGEVLLGRISTLIEKNNEYIIPYMKLTGKNEVGIHGELIYLFLIANYYRGV